MVTVDAPLTNFFLFILDLSPWQSDGHNKGVSSYLNWSHLESPSQLCPGASILGDSKFCQIDSQ